ncbi:MAG: hypothetical protein QW100_02720 [Thermoplasmatales archaeon]
MTEGYEILREMKRNGDEIVFSSRMKRMMLLREIWDPSRGKLMEDISKEYGVNSREKFTEFKEKYNLTDY